MTENKQSLFNQAIEEINRGREGLNEGLPMGFKRLVPYVPNLQRQTYYLVGGATGVGKSAFTDEAFIFNPFESLVKNQDISVDEISSGFEVIYYSFEISKVKKILKAIARRIFKEFNILIDVNYVLSRGKSRMSDEVYQKVMELRNYFEPLEDILTIIDMSQPPAKIKEFTHNHAKKNGTLEIDAKGTAHYHPNNPTKVTEVILDHAGLAQEVNGKNIKQTIDEISQDFVPTRNIYGYSPVLIQQLNFDSSSVSRMKPGSKQSPILGDFGDSKYTTRDADIVLALFSPRRMDIHDYGGYNIDILKDRFRSIEVLKNRDGAPDVSIGMLFVGEVGNFKELPLPTETQRMNKAIDYAVSLKELKPDYNDTTDTTPR